MERLLQTVQGRAGNPAARHDLALLAALSHTTNLSVGCYCEQESRCHRAILREQLTAAGATMRTE